MVALLRYAVENGTHENVVALLFTLRHLLYRMARSGQLRHLDQWHIWVPSVKVYSAAILRGKTMTIV